MQAQPVLPWQHQFQLKGVTLEDREDPRNLGPPRDHQHHQRRTIKEPRWGGGRASQFSKVTWDDRQPPRLVGLPNIIGDFTGILSSIFLRDVGEGEHLHV